MRRYIWVLPSPTPLFGGDEPPLPDLPAVPAAGCYLMGVLSKCVKPLRHLV